MGTSSLKDLATVQNDDSSKDDHLCSHVDLSLGRKVDCS